MAAGTLSLAQATAIKQLTSHTYAAELNNEWAIGSVPHGGYVTACFQRVAKEHFGSTLAKYDQPDLMTLHQEFMRRTEIGPALFTVKDMKLGRATSTVHIALTQAESGGSKSAEAGERRREEVVAYITHTNFGRQEGPTLDTRWRLRAPTPAPLTERGLLLPSNTDPLWGELPQMPVTHLRKATDKLRWFFPRGGQLARGIIDQWVGWNPQTTTPGGAGPAENMAHDALGFVIDAFPQLVETMVSEDRHGALIRRRPGARETSATSAEPGAARPDTDGQWEYEYTRGKPTPYTLPTPGSPSAVRQQGKPASKSFWYPTVLLNLDIKKRLPDAGVPFLFSRVEIKQVRDGRYDIDVTVLDPAGELVATSRHVCMALSFERNLAKRGSGSASGSSSASGGPDPKEKGKL